MKEKIEYIKYWIRLLEYTNGVLTSYLYIDSIENAEELLLDGSKEIKWKNELSAEALNIK